MRAVEKRLRERIKHLEAELADVEADREKFRNDLTRNLRYAIEVHGKGQYWNMPNMIETFAKQLRDKMWWAWW